MVIKNCINIYIDKHIDCAVYVANMIKKGIIKNL